MPLPDKPFAKPFISDKPPILDINANKGDDPDIPYTGLSSSSFTNDNLGQTKTVKKITDTQKRQRSDLLPVAEDIFKFLNEERAAIGDIRSYKKVLGDKPTAAQIEREYDARDLYLNFLERFELWAINRLSKTPASKLRR